MRSASIGIRGAAPIALLLALCALLAGCGAGAGNERGRPAATPPAVGWNGEVDEAPYIAFERVSFERLPKDRLEPSGEVRLPQQARRIAAFGLRDGGTSAIRYTDDDGSGWLAWQPSIVLQARREFAAQRGAQPAQVTTLGVNRVEWPDSCLGVRRAGVSCSAGTVPGFRITLRLGNATAIYHTDLRDRLVLNPG